MKKTLIPGMIALAAVLTLAAKAPKDPVLMTVDGQPVTLSEFEYLYHKNADQQLEQESVDQYLQRFIDYKLKVAQARHERQDTTSDYIKEFRAFRSEIAAPYLTDTIEEQRLIDEAFSHMLEDVKLDHIMLPLDSVALADSVRNAAIAAGTREAFLELAKKHSIDPSLARNGGSYNWVSAGVYPYEWENAAYNTAIDSVSPVVATAYGLHIMRIEAHRPVEGEVHAAHILVSFDRFGGDSVAAKNRADSIYKLVAVDRQDFSAVARELSDCPSGEQTGGDLGFFGRGRMVQEFEDVAFDVLKDGEISQPFTTRFGYHIVKRLGRQMPTKQMAEGEIRAAISRDARSGLPRLSRANQLKQKYNVHFDEAGRLKLLNAVGAIGLDSVVVSMKNDSTALFYVADSVATIADFIATRPRVNPRESQVLQVERMLNNRLNSGTLHYENRHLEEIYPEFRNLSREYSEGLMLFASMEQNVWNRPKTDPAGLEAFFKENYEKYNDWESPRWKGFVIYATEDSLIRKVDEFLKANNTPADSLGQALKGAFPRNIKIERIVLPQGQNPLVDYVAFNGPEYKPADRWKYYITYMGHIINGPEEVADVRGRVTSDWLEKLEAEWVEQLRAKYPVKVNKKVLKKVK